MPQITHSDAHPKPHPRPVIVIVGGGAAGMFAAIKCAESSTDARVLLLEKSPQLLAKVKISGGGRCNVTHACFDPAALVAHYPRGQKELRGPFHAWQPRDTVEWFESRGVPLKTEPDGRMFPCTDQSRTIMDCLIRSAESAGVTLQTRSALQSTTLRKNGRFDLVLNQTDIGERKMTCDKLLLATGGLKPGPLLRLIESAGHTIEPLAPSLFTFQIRDSRLERLAGVSVPFTQVSLPEANLVQSGPLLITHWGLSGPAILKLSAWGARWAQEKNYNFNCRVNWMPEFNESQIKQWLIQQREGQGKKQIRRCPPKNLPKRLWERLVDTVGIAQELTWNRLKRETISSLTEQLHRSDFQVSGQSRFKEEFVTCGGVCLREVDFKTMQSRRQPELYFAGEILDIDGVTGGFNFQSAWTTGWLAGKAMAQE